LIIIDEAHRSIFKKYGALFHYFDALMLGLTATPRSEDNKSSYQVFELPDGTPDFAYELEQAIDEGHLVGFAVLDKTTDKLRRGFTYEELSAEAREECEELEDQLDSDESDDDPRLAQEQFEKFNTHIINWGTIDAMLNDLMKNGIKINGGDSIGKTIIFAPNHQYAVHIVERFRHLYSHLGADFCKLIDSQTENNLALIDIFGERDKLPRIAVSVDMMDTGIDVPDVVNLVFFKTVRSKIKFLQMIGRGTRLSPDLFGPGLNKEGFLVFDYFDNFRYFNVFHTWSALNEPSGSRSFSATPQSVLINRRRLNILRALSEKSGRDLFEEKYLQQLRSHFVTSLRSLCNDDIEVTYNMAYVSKYRTEEQWLSFSDQKVEDINARILPLMPSETGAPPVKSFDLLMYILEDEVPQFLEAGKSLSKIRNGFMSVEKAITMRVEELLKLKSIPAIVQKEQLLRSMIDCDAVFTNFSLENCEAIRLALRDLMQFLPEKEIYHIIDVADFVIDQNAEEVVKEPTYEEKVQNYLANAASPALAKIQNLDELTDQEKNDLEFDLKSRLGTPADFAALANGLELLPFLRVQLGISPAAIQTKFGSFLNDSVLDAMQLNYMQQIIDYARTNGDIKLMDLQRVSPFCDVDVVALFGTNLGYIKTLVDGLHKPVM